MPPATSRHRREHGSRYIQAPHVAFVSQWALVDYPRVQTVSLLEQKVEVEEGDVIWLLVSESTNNMQTLLANAAINFTYRGGRVETLKLPPPINFWTISPVGGVYYDYVRDGFCLPRTPPRTVQLGEAHTANVYSWRATGAMEAVSVEALSLEVVIGLLAVSVSQPSDSDE